MQASGNQIFAPHEHSSFNDPANTNGQTVPEASKSRMAKKTGKSNLKPQVTSQAVDPNKFLKEYEKTMEANRERKWLQSNEVFYKEPPAVNKVDKPGPGVLMPPFSSTQNKRQNSLNSSNQLQANIFLQSQPPKNDDILQVIEDFQVIETHRADLNRLSPSQRLKLAHQRLNLGMNAGTKCIVAGGAVQKESQKGHKDQTRHIHNSDSNDMSYKQVDPFKGINHPKYSPSISPPKENERPTLNTSNQPTQIPQPNQPPQPNANKNLRSFSPPPNNNNQSVPAPTQPPPPTGVNLANNPTTINSNSPPPQINSSAIPAANNQTNVFDNARANLQNNTSNSFTANQPSQQKITNYFSNLKNNQPQVNYSNNPSTNQSTQISNSSQGSYKVTNNQNPQTNFHNIPNNSDISNYQANYPNRMTGNPNPTINATLVMNINQPRPYVPRVTQNMEGDWIVKYACHPDWHQYRLNLANKLKNRPLTDQSLNLLAAITFQSRHTVSLGQIQKYAQQIIMLGTHFDRAKNKQSELLCKEQYDRAQSKSDHLQIGFKLQSFLEEINELYPRQFSSYNDAEIQSLLKNKRIMTMYSKIQDETVQQFVRAYERFKYSSTKQLESITIGTKQLLKKNEKIRGLLRILKEQQRSNQQLEVGTSLTQIQEKQQSLFRVMEYFSCKLQVGNKIMPKNELYYQLSNIITLQKQQNKILQEVPIWRELRQESEKGEPYKQVFNIIDRSTLKLATKVSDIEDLLRSAIGEYFDNPV